MSEKVPQTLANHGRIDPMFHYVLIPALLLCFGFAIWFTIRRASPTHIWLDVFSFIVLLLALHCRRYATKVQDRVIRLEERLRLAALLPAALQARTLELSEGQLIALRFASDEELSELTDRTLREGLQAKAIKQSIRSWRPDYWRV
ncbi:hypothetical protein ACPOL_4167 [Acidisarcina polymorpha]|uniref:Uncharacterized protein n=1 Tax=Acidisarcina polymorpha TaxID=2211140 RepID=A0A2Z5G3S1_9BACT|nr:DUF6526 family protein [Acidisarcina polymorpha]AXC13444.1 hypothetical protein ACPOL_4167 [Acidisarcina polymorpha]